MFNGIIFNKGKVYKIQRRKNGINLFLKSNIKVSKKDLGLSISCDGVCLTLISCKKKIIEFYISKETLNKSKFKNINIGDEINLELPLKFGKKISGHICQGHVDTTGKVLKVEKIDKSNIFEFRIKKNLIINLVKKSSILINGVSLTISKINKHSFEIWAIPHTLKLTNLKKLNKNDLVNIEIDILSKYVRKYLNAK
tara:strand:- start:502 stop:1092 length:591 start_codon:yes stop_codon:yes gene_type:complete